MKLRYNLSLSGTTLLASIKTGFIKFIHCSVGLLTKSTLGLLVILAAGCLMLASAWSAPTASAATTWQNNQAKCKAVGGTWTAGACDVSALTNKGVGDSPEELNDLVLDRQTFFYLSSCFIKIDMDTVPSSEVENWQWLKVGSGFGDFLNGISDAVTSIPYVGGIYEYAPGVAISRKFEDKTAVRGDMYENPATFCEDGQWLSEAFGRYGLTDPEQAFCSLGFTFNKDTGGNGKKGPDGRQDTQACIDGSGDYDGAQESDGNDNWQEAQGNGLYDLLKKSNPTKFAATNTELLPAANYIRQYRTFANVCDPTFERPWKDGDSTSKTIFKVPIVVPGADGTIISQDMYVSTGKADENTKSAYVATRDGGVVERSCRDLSSGMESSSVAYATWLENNPDALADASGPSDDGDGGGGETNSCAVDGVGWVVCPVLNFMATINEEAFDFISAQLEIKPELLADSETRAAWSSFRDLANVAFVIAFLVIIYSQITGAGISNYGLKKMLPKLIVAAVLVNSSYILCQIAVDLSNIIGGSTYSFFKDIPITDGDGTVSGGGGPRGWQDVVSAILILGLAAAALVLAASTLGVAALLAFMLVILILVARKALLILLIVISPLAFVAYLLPNTEQWFKKWWKTFSTLLMLFPTVGLIFGASFLASRIVGNSPGGDGDGDGALFIQITALGIMAIPLFAIPIVLKGAMAAAGAVGAKLSGGLDKATGAAGNKGKDRYKNSAFAQGREQRKGLKQKYKQGKLAGAMANPSDASRYNRVRARMARGVTGRSYSNAGDYAQEAMTNSAQVEADKIYEEGVKGAGLRQAGMTNKDVAAMAATGKDAYGVKLSEHEHVAAVDRIMKTGSFDERRAALEHLASNKSTTSTSLRSRAVQGAIGRGDQNIYGVDFANQLMSEKGTINSAADLAQAAQTNAATGKVSAEHLVQSAGATKYIADVATGELKDAAGSPVLAADAYAMNNLREAAASASTGEQTKTKVTGDIKKTFNRF